MKKHKQAVGRKALGKDKRMPRYSALDVLFASDSQPLDSTKREHQLGKMREGLLDLSTCEKPLVQSWRILSDAINMMETLTMYGEAPHKLGDRVVASHWRGCDGDPVEIRDSSGLLLDAITAMSAAGVRANRGESMCFTEAEADAVQAVLDDYQAVLEYLPARTMLRCHRATEVRMLKLLRQIGNLPEGVSVMAL